MNDHWHVIKVLQLERNVAVEIRARVIHDLADGPARLLAKLQSADGQSRAKQWFQDGNATENPSGFTRIMKLHWKNQSEVEHEPCRVLQESIKMWARIDQVWSFYRSSMLPFLFLLSIKCFLYVSLSVENICENLSKNNIEKEISQNVNLSSFFDKNFWICNFCHLCILTSASFFWWIVFWG